MSTKEDRAQLAKLYDQQHGKCHWCGIAMRPPGSFVPRRGRKLPKDLCTYDHLDDRFSAERGKHAWTRRNVAACWQCNFDRHIESQKSQPIELLRQRSKQHDGK